MQARFEVHGINSDDTVRRSTGIVLGYQSPTDYYFCGLAADPSDVASSTPGASTTTGSATSSSTTARRRSRTQMPGDWTLISARTSQTSDGTTTITCGAARDSVTGQTSFGIQDHVGGTVGVRTNDADVSFDYVFVVAVPSPD